MVNPQSYVAKVKNKLKSIRQENSNFADTNLIKMLMFEKFIDRVNLSRYKDDITFKGGFVLSYIFNVVNRTSGDLDYIFKLHKRGSDYKRDIYNAINEILKVEIDDGATFEPVGYQNIMDTKEFDGIRVKLNGKLYKLSNVLTIDIMIVDDSDPKYLERENVNFKSLDTYQGETSINMNIDTFENIISDKISAIINLGADGTRLRDYYDIFLFHKFYDMSKLNYELLGERLLSKIKYEPGLYLTMINSIFKDRGIILRWNDYYAKNANVSLNIQLDDIKQIILNIINKTNILK